MGSPLWRLFPAMGRQRGVRGDFIEIFDSIGVEISNLTAAGSIRVSGT